ncbi:CD1375 family protein [Paenibacillus dakarensis]|nr:CD1375 family protein [Paenibacillus dakarensis]
MVDLYYKLVREGKRTIEEVPERFRMEVQEKSNA